MVLSNRKLILPLLVSGLLIAKGVYAAEFTGNGTPTEYLLTISQIAFHKTGDPASTYTIYASSTGQFDIAAVNPGTNVGILNESGVLTSGTYDKIRFTVSKTMSIKGSFNGTLSNGVTCRTTSNPTVVNDPLGDGSIDRVYLGATDGGVAELETVTVPSGSNVEASEDFTDLGTSFRGTLPVNFTVTNAVPTVTVKFNVTNALQFIPYGPAQCAVFPGPPTVTVVVS